MGKGDEVGSGRGENRCFEERTGVWGRLGLAAGNERGGGTGVVMVSEQKHGVPSVVVPIHDTFFG